MVKKVLRSSQNRSPLSPLPLYPSPKFVGRAGIFGLFWGLWGFLLCSWLVGCQALRPKILSDRKVILKELMYALPD